MDGFATDGTILNARSLVGMSGGPGDDFHLLCGDELFPVVDGALFHVYFGENRRELAACPNEGV